MDKAVFAAGCFWCIEAIFQMVNGVSDVTPGYSGGKISNPTYKEVCSGLTGHAEVIMVEFDPTIVSYEELLVIFWSVHDPTTLNRQGADVGTQYRSAIFYMNESQKKLAIKSKNELDNSGALNNKIVTEIIAFEKFYKAEAYHDDYYNNNKSQPYCNAVITPKIEKFKKTFDKLLK